MKSKKKKKKNKKLERRGTRGYLDPFRRKASNNRVKRNDSIFRKDRSLYGVERPWITKDAFKLIYSLVNTMAEGKGGSMAAAVSENCAISIFSLLFGQCRANVHVPRPRTRGWNNLFRVVRSNIYFRVRNIWWQEETVEGGNV